jgi:hypothetical protein
MNLELAHALRILSVRCAETIRTGVPAADNDDVLAVRSDLRSSIWWITKATTIRLH